MLFSAKRRICCLHVAPNDIAKSDEGKIRFVRNDLQLKPTVQKANSRWLCVFLISRANPEIHISPPMNTCVNAEDNSWNFLTQVIHLFSFEITFFKASKDLQRLRKILFIFFYAKTLEME
ncbi:hypothetical protein TNCV_4670741 [Trichonephila clavipes]|nr:hypothetical protein TNCV_4670741 [Trichonephila clavipes]